MAGLVNAAKAVMLNGSGFAANAVFVSLHTADPGASGTSELTGGSPAYARKAVTWGSGATGTMTASNTPVFDVPASTITHLGYWSASTAGTYYGSRPLDTNQVFATQGTYTATSITETLTQVARYSAAVSKASGAAAAWHTQFRTAATRDARVWEVHVFAETAVAGNVGLIRSATVGTTFTANTVPQAEDSSSGVAVSLVDTAITTPPTVAGTPVYLRRAQLSATIGSGIIWTFPTGLVVPVSAGLLVWQLSALAVTYGVTFVFDE